MKQIQAVVTIIYIRNFFVLLENFLLFNRKIYLSICFSKFKKKNHIYHKLIFRKKTFKKSGNIVKFFKRKLVGAVILIFSFVYRP